MATCFVSSNGLKVTVEQAKCVQANAFIQSTLFQQFTFLPDAPAVFRINLAALIVSDIHACLCHHGNKPGICCCH